MPKDPRLKRPLAGLKGTRLAIAHLLLQGYSELEVAEQLCLSPSSIKKYVINLKERMNCKKLHGLTAILMRMSLEEALKDQNEKKS